MSSPRLVLGLSIMAVGVLITCDNLGLLDAGAYLRYWPAAVILVGALKLAERGPFGPASFAGWVWIGVGGVLLLAALGYLRLSVLLPLALVLIGARIVARSLGPARREEGRGQPGEGFVSCTALLGGSSRASASQSFSGGDLTAFMGGCELELRQAAIAQPPAVIDVFAMWGGMEIRVPERWCVEPKVAVVLGGLEDSTSGGSESCSERLVVRGLVLMGGIEIKN